MKRDEEHFRLVRRISELKRLKLQNGRLSMNEQIKYDRCIRRITYLSQANCEDVKQLLKEIGYTE